MQNVQEAPTFSPTEEEWRDPIKYINKIRKTAEIYGICKIRSPATFKPPFSVDKANFRFKTRIQNIQAIDGIARVERTFTETVKRLLFENGTPMLKKPGLLFHTSTEKLNGEIRDHNNKRLSLYKLYDVVRNLGGSKHMYEANLWGKATEILFGTSSPSPELVALFKEAYETYLLQYEMSLNIEQDSEIEHDIFDLGLSGVLEAQKQINLAKLSLASIEIVKNDQHVREEKEIEPDGRLFGRNNDHIDVKPGMSFWKYFPGRKVCFRGKIIEKVRQNLFVVKYKDKDCVKSFEAAKSRAGNLAQHQNKKAKTENIGLAAAADDGSCFYETLERSSIQLFLLSGETAELAFRAFENGLCQVCVSSADSNKLVKCVGCDCNYHTFCIKPRLAFVPNHDWFCSKCLDTDSKDFHSSLSSFGFEDGSYYTLNQFKEMAKETFDEILDAADVEMPKTDDEFEEFYWNILTIEARKENSDFFDESMSISYGSDLDTAKVGSGFPTAQQLARKSDKNVNLAKPIGFRTDKNYSKTMSSFEKVMEDTEEFEEYVTHPWNLNNFPTAEGSLLNHVDSSITGVMVPWLYIGMALSSFCFHVEDHNFSSINYHHFGAPKVWYGVSSDQGELFEKCCRELCPDLFVARKDILTGIVTQFCPSELIAISKGTLKIHKVVQRPGDFVLTFPKAYHGGFNQGFNCAEAVNFATHNWLPYGEQCFRTYKTLKKNPVIAHETLLCTLVHFLVAEEKKGSYWLQLVTKLLPIVKQMVSNETSRRIRVKSLLQSEMSTKNSIDNTDSEDDEEESKCHSNRSSPRKQRDNSYMSDSLSKVEGRERGSTHGVLSGSNDLHSSLYQCNSCRTFCSLSYFSHKRRKAKLCLECAEDVQPSSADLRKKNWTVIEVICQDELNNLSKMLQTELTAYNKMTKRHSKREAAQN